MKNPPGITTKTTWYPSFGFCTTVYHQGRQWDGPHMDSRDKARRAAIKQYLYQVKSGRCLTQ